MTPLNCIGTRKQFLWGVFAVSLLIRLAILAYSINYAPEELWEHGAIAHNLYHGYGFSMHWPYGTLDSNRLAVQAEPPTHEGAFLPPLNPYLLVSFYYLFGKNQTALAYYGILLAILSSLVPIVIFYLTCKFERESVARLAAILASLNLLAAYAVATYSGSTLYHLLAPLSLLSLIAVCKKENIFLYGLVGIITGVMTMVRSEYFIFGPAMILLAAFVMRKRVSVRVRFIVIALVAHGLVVTPWAYRNYRLFGEFVPVLSHPWYEMWRGNSPRTNGKGNSVWVNSKQDRELIKAMDALPYNERFEVATDSIFKVEVVKFWKDNPMSALGLGIKKVGFFFTSDFLSSIAVSITISLFSLTMLFFAIAGIISSYRKKTDEYARPVAILFAFFLVSYLALIFLTIMFPRYQIYVLNTLLPMTASGAALTWKNIRGEVIVS